MAVELVIKIPENYDLSKIQNGSIASKIILNAVANGTPLPKGHRRLSEDNFDVGPVFDEKGHRVGYKYVTQEDLNNATTIIAADNTNSEE